MGEDSLENSVRVAMNATLVARDAATRLGLPKETVAAAEAAAIGTIAAAHAEKQER